MDESERSEPSSNEPQPPSDPQPAPPHGESETPQPQGQQLGDGAANRRRRRGGPPRPAGGGWRQRGGAGQQRYQDTIRRVTAGPRATAPSHQLAGEPIAGPHAILEAMRAGRGIRRVYVSEDRGTRTGAVND